MCSTIDLRTHRVENGYDMNKEALTPEIQNYMETIQEKRSHSGWLPFDVCQQILEYAAEKNSDALLGLGYYYLAENYWYQEDNEKIMECLTECAKYFRTAKMHEYIARTYNMMGAVSDRWSSPMIAIGYYYIALQYAEKYHIYYAQAMAENNIAYTLVRMKRQQEAIQRYQSAIACYEKAEESYNRRRNQLGCMVECGFCHMSLQDTEQAFALEQQIVDFLRQYSDIEVPSESVWLYYAICETVRGNKENADRLVDQILEALGEEEAQKKFIRYFVAFVAFLDGCHDDGRLSRLMEILQKGIVEQHISIYLDCYPYLADYLLRQNKTIEYMQYTKKYFRLYKQYEQENRKVAAMMLELRDKLKIAETKQDNMRAYNKKLENLALHDSMTGLANRTFLNEYLAKQFDRAFLKHELLGVELMDVDCFKQYNDTYGHLSGDRCLEAIADVLKEVQNEGVFCARYGGDEFVVIYSGMELEEIRQTAKAIQERIRALEIPHIYNVCANHVTVSQGVFVRIPKEENREWDFNAMADKALYEAKSIGRNCFCVRTEFE